MSMSSSILFNCKPGPLLCSCSSTSSFIFKFKFPARSQCSPLPTVEFHATKPRASTHNHNHNHISIENESVSGASTSRRRSLVFVAATTTPLLLLFNHEASAVKAAGLATTTSENYLLIKEEVRKVLSKAKAAGVLRLVFHDAGTFDMDENSGGMNGSIVYELDRPENAGLKKPMKILEKAKTEVDAVKPVSWADMIAVAGAEAVSLCGGPTIPVPLGRLDSMEPDPEGKLPQESLDAPGLKQSFQRKGLSTQDLVVLSGAHTLGSKGFGNPTVFDNSYFKILLQKPWTSSGGMASMVGLPSDRALTDDNECLRWITKYAENQSMFFEDFKNAYTKLVSSGAKWKSV
ncbi:putative L-ascorbate peroxidase 6 [Quercus robur]|uniref:putative L-ascorbate peroxidase 6 n=1 Tax=Quercus robur TaxID=38942 RepID=UPI00216279D5|nr:putative L-ascorbate peroxidase 6 [Quercus robur]